MNCSSREAREVAVSLVADLAGVISVQPINDSPKGFHPRIQAVCR